MTGSEPSGASSPLEVRPGGGNRVDRVPAADYTRDIDSRPLTELRELRDEAAQQEGDLSYLRRLLHVRIDVVEAELRRRVEGGSTSGVEQLVTILTDNTVGATTGRYRTISRSAADAYHRHVETLVADFDLSDIKSVSEDTLHQARQVFRDEEASVSQRRREVQSLVDELNAEIASRYRRGSAAVDDLVAAERVPEPAAQGEGASTHLTRRSALMRKRRSELVAAGRQLVGSVEEAINDLGSAGRSAPESVVTAAVHAALTRDGAAPLLWTDPSYEPEFRLVVDDAWRAVADVILRAVMPEAGIRLGERDVLGAALSGALRSTVRRWFGNAALLKERPAVEQLVIRIVSRGVQGLVDDRKRAAIRELDESDAQARAGYRHLIQRVLPVQPRASHAIPVSIYLESGTDATAVEAAVREVLDSYGILVEQAKDPIIGSWFRLLLGRTKEALTSPEMADILTRLERAIELQALHKPQAEINSAELDGVAKLITALGQEHNACVQIGSVFLLKVDGTIVSRTVSQREMAFLERNPGLLSTPREVLAALDEAARTAASADQVSIQDGSVRLTVQRPDDRGCLGLTIAVNAETATTYDVGFDAANGPVPVSAGVTYVHAEHGCAVIRAQDVTITVRRLPEPAKQFELVVASGNGRRTSYELDFAQ